MKATLISLSLTGGQIPKPSHSGECAYDASCRLVRQNEKGGGFVIGSGGWPTLGGIGSLKHRPAQSTEGSGKTFQGSEKTIQGSRKTFQGSEKTIHGFCKTFQGSEKTIQGFRKTFQGSGKTIQGFRETIQGSGKTIQGFRKTIQGPEKTIHGSRKTFQGSGKTIQGFWKTRRVFRRGGRGEGPERRSGGSLALDLAARWLGARFSLEGAALTCRPWEAQAFRFRDGLRWPLFGCLFFGRTPPCGQGIRNS